MHDTLSIHQFHSLLQFRQFDNTMFTTLARISWSHEWHSFDNFPDIRECYQFEVLKYRKNIFLV